jgi:hypothetical protein
MSVFSGNIDRAESWTEFQEELSRQFVLPNQSMNESMNVPNILYRARFFALPFQKINKWCCIFVFAYK